MSYKRLDAEDFLVSVDSITSTVWSDNTPTLTTFFTASTGANTNDAYYRNVFKTATSESVQFAIAYGDSDGSGSLLYNPLVDGNSPSKTVYGQFRNLVYGDENTDFSFEGTTPKNIWAVPIERARYKERLMPGTINLKLTSGSADLVLTDNSAMVTTNTFLECGRVYQLISGSNGTSFDGGTGYSSSNGSYGLFLPDVSLIILNPLAVAEKIPLATTDRTSNIAAGNIDQAARIFKEGSSFGLNSEETLTSDFVFVRARNSEFNYSENPSFISGSTGDVLHSSMINSPQSFLTTVGLYNDTNELLAVAKLSKPLTKDFTKETLLRVKLDF
jgi:hypothetical protein